MWTTSPLVLLRRIGRSIGSAIVNFRMRLEVLLAIPLIEGLVRLWYHLDARVYSERLRIRAITGGRIAKKSDKYVVFVLVANAPLPAFIRNIVDAFARSPFNLIIVSNAELNLESKDTFLDCCHLLIERVNLGRDFGGYKDGISVLRQRFPKIDRLILINDSLFFFANGLDRLVADLDSEQDLIGLTEVFEHHYHVQSFLLSIGPRVLAHETFANYWRRYRPISSRRWSVHKGEVGFTRRMTKAGFRPHVLYHGAQLIPYFKSRPPNEIMEAVRLLPNYFRNELYEAFEDLQAGWANGAVGSVDAVSKAIHSLHISGFEDQALLELRDANLRQIRRVSQHAEIATNLILSDFAAKIVSTIIAHNQIHTGGFLFMKHLGLPVIKRDLFYRDVYALEDIYDILTDLAEPLRDEVLTDLRRTGNTIHFNPLQRLLFRHGSI